VVVGRQAAIRSAEWQSLVTVFYREPVTEVSITEAPTPNSVVPRLIATSDVVVGQLLHGFECVEATSVDRCGQKRHPTKVILPSPKACWKTLTCDSLVCFLIYQYTKQKAKQCTSRFSHGHSYSFRGLPPRILNLY